MTTPTPFLMGVNYWPRRKAMYWWENFDAAEAREELSMIRDIGLTHVRFFLLWESFQPAPDRISLTALRDLRLFCDIAAELNLRLEPTFFTGHMSGPNWPPPWLHSKEPASRSGRWMVSLNRHTPSEFAIYNPYSEPFVLEAQQLQLRTICKELADHPAIWAWSLGNEPDLFARPRDDQEGKSWIRLMTQTIKSVDPIHPVLIGFHTASIDDNVGLRVDHAAQETDISVMHGYSIYNPVARRKLDPDYVPFTCALTAALAGRPVLYEEFGLAMNLPDAPSGNIQMTYPNGYVHTQFMASSADAADYYAQVLPRLQRVGALGAFAWCFGDYDQTLWDKPPCDAVIHERFFGLFRADGSLKPMGQAVRDFAHTNPRVQPSERPVTLGMTPDDYYRDPLRHQKDLYSKFGTLD